MTNNSLYVIERSLCLYRYNAGLATKWYCVMTMSCKRRRPGDFSTMSCKLNTCKQLSLGVRNFMDRSVS